MERTRERTFFPSQARSEILFDLESTYDEGL